MDKRIRFWLVAFLAAMLVLGVLSLSGTAVPQAEALVATPTPTPPPGVWRTTFPADQGEVRVVEASSDYESDGTVYAGTTLGGVWRTTNWGESWQEVNAGLPSREVVDLAISLTNTYGQRTIFVVLKDQGLFRSSNSGESWVAIAGGFANLNIRTIVISPNYLHDQTIYLGLQSVEQAEVYRSTDGGISWTLDFSSKDGGPIQDLTLSPNYAQNHTDRWALCHFALFKAKADGTGWERQSLQRPRTYRWTWFSTIVAASPTDLYVGMTAPVPDPAVLFRSLDSGLTWSVLPYPFSYNDHPWQLISSPNYLQDHTVFMAHDWDSWHGGNTRGIRMSTDKGDTWLSLNEGLPNQQARSVSVGLKDGYLQIFAGTTTKVYQRVPPAVSLNLTYLDAVQVVDGQDIPLVKGKDTAIKVRVKNTGTAAAHNVRVSVTANGVSQGPVTRNRFYREERATQQTGYIFTGDPEDHLDVLSPNGEKTLYFFDDSGALNPVGVENATSWYNLSASITCDEGAADTEQLTKEIVEPTWYRGSQEFRIAYVPTGLPANEISWRLWEQKEHWQQEISDLLRARIPVDKAKFVIDPPVYNLSLPLRLYQNSLGVIPYEEYVHWCQDAAKWLTVGLRPDATNTLYVLVLPRFWYALNFVWYKWPQLEGSVPIVNMSERIRLVAAEAPDPGTLYLTNEPNPYEVFAHEVGHWINIWEIQDRGLDCHVIPGGLWVSKKMALYPAGDTYTYCPIAWITQQDYRVLLRGFSTRTGVLSLSSTLDADEGAVVVSGWVARNGEAGFDSAWVVPEGTSDIDQLHSGASEEYRLQVLDRSGGVLFDHPLLISFDDPEGGQTEKTYFLASIPNYHSAAEIRLLHQEVSVATKTVSDNQPVVEILSPQPGEVVRGDFTIRWRGTDADRDPLSYYVSVSADNGQNWMGVVDAGGEITATEVIWHSNQEVPPGTTYRVRVRVSDGYHSTTAASGSFSVQSLVFLPLLGKAPTPTPTPTATPTKTLTPTPTATPIPTATPAMGSATIWGRCQRDGNPLPGVEISIGSGDGNSTWEPKSRTNNEGYFHFFGVQVPPGGTTYGLWPTDRPYCRQSVHVNDRDYVGPLIFNFDAGGSCH